MGVDEELTIAGMTCASCVVRVERALLSVPGVHEATVNLATNSARLTHEGADKAALAKAVLAAGYEVVGGPVDESALYGRRALVAALATVPIVLYSMVVLPLRGPLPYDVGVILGLATFVQFGPGRMFLLHAWRAARSRTATMDTLVALGTLSAYGLSLFVLLDGRGLHATYFETGAVIIALILLGRYLEARARQATASALRSLLEGAPQIACRVADDHEEWVPITAVRPGDTLLVKQGEKVPVDGTVLGGTIEVDESLLTGEPNPVLRAAGEAVLGGSLLVVGTLRMEATRRAGDSLLGQMERLVREANARKAPLQKLADRVSSVFVPIVLALAVAGALVWAIVPPVFVPMDATAFGVLIAVSVLVVACPCAMGLATPTAILVGTTMAARRGILLRGGEALERTMRIDTFILDKTGTLTEGRPKVVAMESDGMRADAALSLVAAVERESPHPLAVALVAEADKAGVAKQAVEAHTSVVGQGAKGRVGGIEVKVGRLGWLPAAPAGLARAIAVWQEQGDTVVAASFDGRLAWAAALRDPLRVSSKEAVAGLRRQGQVVLATGDHEAAARRIAAEVGIDVVHADLTPEAKSELVRRLQSDGAVAMIGDGINDAAALAQADVGIAMGTGSDLAKETGDIVLVHADLMAAVEALRLSRLTVRTVRQNLGWAFAYNLLLIPVALGVLYPAFQLLLDPMLAAAAMSLSSLSVVGNALLMRQKA